MGAPQFICFSAYPGGLLVVAVWGEHANFSPCRRSLTTSAISLKQPHVLAPRLRQQRHCGGHRQSAVPQPVVRHRRSRCLCIGAHVADHRGLHGDSQQQRQQQQQYQQQQQQQQQPLPQPSPYERRSPQQRQQQFQRRVWPESASRPGAARLSASERTIRVRQCWRHSVGHTQLCARVHVQCAQQQ